jgi:putative DNA primase/helicase
VLDVHPFNVSKIVDPSVPLWITEGVKKGDALTSAGQCAISLSGVFNWRSRYLTLGEWEDVLLRGRQVLICFDSDAATNRNVASAMLRLRNFLHSRGADVRYIVTPEVDGLGGKTGVDDYLAHCGSVDELLNVASKQPPDPDAGDDSLSDSRLAEQVAEQVLAVRFRYVRGLGWLEYDGSVWRDSGEERVVEATRVFLKGLLKDAAGGTADVSRLHALAALQSSARIGAISRLTKGMECVRAEVEDFDADPWLLNAANGVVDLRSGELLDHNPEYLMRHHTGIDFRPEAVHPDWALALEALPDAETVSWAQCYLGTGVTGLTPREDVATFWHGGGSNGKSTVLGAVQSAIGTYAKALLPTMLGGKREEHPTEYMDLLGTRLAFVEETGEGHRLDTVKLKKFQGTEIISGRRMRQDPVSFRASHTLVVTTNYRPVVTDTDHGTWRRLRMIPFPKTFGRGGRPVDRGLRGRLMTKPGQQEAVLAWLVQGATSWHQSDCQLPEEPPSIKEATRLWRESTDLIFAFVEERIDSEPGHYLDVERLREEFNDWLPSPHQPWGRQTFAERFDQHEAMRALGAVRGQHPKTRRSAFKGVALKVE